MRAKKSEPNLFEQEEKTPPGLTIFRARLAPGAQKAWLDEVARIVLAAPLLTPTMANGQPFRLKLTNAGELGWVSDNRGYLYTDRHPVTDKCWPAIPPMMSQLAHTAAADAGFAGFVPNSCLINSYEEQDNGSLGLHRDLSERDFTQPVVSVSLGDACTFRMGGLERDDPKTDYELRSGDVLVFGGALRKAWHAVPKIRYFSGRINVTLRRA